MTVETLTSVLRRRRPWLEATGWIVAAIGFAGFAWLMWQAIQRDGGSGYDIRSYLLAARHLLEGEPLYAPVSLNAADAYRYPPTFAVFWIPATLAPELVVTWAYRGACLLCLRYLVGSWRAVGWSLLVAPVWIELAALNVTLPIAAASRWALRGGPSPSSGTGAGVALTPATAAVKWGTAVLLPYLWIRRPGRRRALAVGAGALALVVAIHALLDPAAWGAYVAALLQQAQSSNAEPTVGEQLIVIIPNTLADFALRVAIAVVLMVLAIRRRWDWLAFAAATIAVPTLWLARLAPLVAVPRLWSEERRSRARVETDLPRRASVRCARSPHDR